MIPDRYNIHRLADAIRNPNLFREELIRLYRRLFLTKDHSVTQHRLEAAEWEQARSALDVTVERFENNPLITPDSDARIGTNINGPSIIRVPEWVTDPLGEYYLYFGHHDGEFIRLAYADDITGPWRVHSPGTLHRTETRFDDHIASPDVHVDHENQRIRMYFHGCCGLFEHDSGRMTQVTDVAVSEDGIDFEVYGESLGSSYFRVWEYDDRYYALANDGYLYRGDNPLEPFERRQKLFPRNRHFAVRFVSDDLLQVFLTRRGDRPERLSTAIVSLSADDETWGAHPHPPETVLWPERDYEGGRLPLVTSSEGSADEPMCALRDPAVIEENGHSYLFYTIAGERGIAGGRIR